MYSTFFNCLSLVAIEASATGWWEISAFLPKQWVIQIAKFPLFFLAFPFQFNRCSQHWGCHLHTGQCSAREWESCSLKESLLTAQSWTKHSIVSNNIIQFNPVYMGDKSEEGSCHIQHSQTGCQMVILHGCLSGFQGIAPLWWSPHLQHGHEMVTSDCQTNKKHIPYTCIVCCT